MNNIAGVYECNLFKTNLRVRCTVLQRLIVFYSCNVNCAMLILVVYEDRLLQFITEYILLQRKTVTTGLGCISLTFNKLVTDFRCGIKTVICSKIIRND